MSVSANKLVYDTFRKSNSIGSGKGKKISVADVVAYLNEAQEIWYENKIAASEENDKISNDLRKFKIKKLDIGCEIIDCNCCKVKYPEDFYKLLNGLSKSCGEGCCEGINKDIIINVLQSDDLQQARKDEFRKSSFEWERLISDEAGDGLYIYHDGSQEVTSVCIDYYRKPKRIEAPELVNCRLGYEDWDKKLITKNQDFEVCETFANRQISDIAALLILRDTMNTESFTTQLQKILQIDRLYRRV